MPTTHVCDKGEKIDKIDERLHEGERLFDELHRDIKELVTVTGEIRDQTVRTNGRVTKLERLKTNIMYLIIGVAICSADGPQIVKAIISVVK